MDELVREHADPRPLSPETRTGFDRRSRDWLRAARPWNRLAYIIRALPAAIERESTRLRLGPGDTVLDFGCADTHYRSIFPDGVVYLGADLPGNPAASVQVREDETLPLPDESVEAVLSTQVLEHVLDPAVHLEECRRVLRPGGRLLLSTHGIMVLHPDPVDLWRWTSDGLRHQVEAAGLHVVSFEGVMGLAATGLQLFQDATWGNLPRLLRAPWALVMQSLIAICERFQSDRSRRYNALVFILVAEKPVSVGERGDG